MIDSHTHLDSCEPPNDELVAAAREAGVTKMLTVGMDETTNRSAIAAADTYPEVFAAVGRHPNAATGYGDAASADLAQLAAHPRVMAIGETGLDFYRDSTSPEDQARAFSAQIALARATGKPLVIHTRDAEEQTIAQLEAEADGVTVLLHCFSMPDHVERCADNGWWFSFAGNVTYPRNSELARAAARAPADRLLVETDAPYLTPQTQRKHRNQPAFVAHTAAFVADRRGLAYDELDALVSANAQRLFDW